MSLRKKFNSTKEDTAQRVFDEVTKKYRGRGRRSLLAHFSRYGFLIALLPECLLVSAESQAFRLSTVCNQISSRRSPEVATFASKFLSESDDALEHMAMAGLSAKQLLNSLQLGICVIAARSHLCCCRPTLLKTPFLWSAVSPRTAALCKKQLASLAFSLQMQSRSCRTGLAEGLVNLGTFCLL